MENITKKVQLIKDNNDDTLFNINKPKNRIGGSLNVYKPYYGNDLPITEIVIWDNLVDLEKLKSYIKELDQKIDDAYSDFCNNAIAKYEKIGHNVTQELVDHNEERLNKNIEINEEIIQNHIFEWHAAILNDLDVREEEERELIVQKYKNRIDLDFFFDHYSIFSAEPSRYPFPSKDKRKKSNAEIVFNELAYQLDSNHMLFTRKKLAKIESYKKEMLNKNNPLYSPKQTLNSYETYKSHETIALYLSRLIGIVRVLEDIVSEQELNRTENYVKGAELSLKTLNMVYRGDKKGLYIKNHYDYMVKSMVSVGVELSTLDTLLSAYEDLNTYRTFLKNIKHPLMNYGYYRTMIDRIKHSLLYETKSYLARDLFENDYNLNLIYDELKELDNKKQPVYLDEKIISREPLLAPTFIVDDPKVRVSLRDRRTNKMIDVETKLKK